MLFQIIESLACSDVTPVSFFASQEGSQVMLSSLFLLPHTEEAVPLLPGLFLCVLLGAVSKETLVFSLTRC